MKLFSIISTALVALVPSISAVGVSGAAEGFAKGVTGGGSAKAVYPSTTAELVSYLGDSSPRLIVLTKTFDFTNTEGTVTSSGCAPWGTGSACQIAINKDNWCSNYEPKAPKVNSITYNKAGVLGITVASNKSLIGQGSAGVIKGKGLRIVSGAKNIIIQNIAITNINPQYVWGGDGITVNNADLIWIDHVKTSLIGRQHLVLGTQPSNRITISASEFDGQTSWSATCDAHHYWTLYLTGSADMVTLKNNYIHHTSGRAPKVDGNTLLHAVNNYWYANTGHAFEVGAGGSVVAEGNVFQNVKAVVEAGAKGKVFAAPDANANKACKAGLGRDCVVNAFGSSGVFGAADTSVLSKFNGKNVAKADAAMNALAWVKANAGVGKV